MFIGTYRDYMYFNGPSPWLLGSFAIYVVYREAILPVPAPPVRFEIRLETLQQSKVVYGVESPVFDNPHTVSLTPNFDWNVNLFRQARFTVALNQLVVEGHSRLSVYAFAGSNEILIDRLRIVQNVPLPPPVPTGSIDLFNPSPPALPPRLF